MHSLAYFHAMHITHILNKHMNQTTSDTETQTPKVPSPLVSLLPLAVLVGLLVITIRRYGSDALDGASQVVLLISAAVCVLIGMIFYKVPWKAFEDNIIHNVASTTGAIVILLLIGALSGTWMVSGVVPSLIYYGMKIIHPDVFLASSCIISALVSLMTGSSWTTIATIGIALMGIGRAQGFDDGWIAGAIISGAYFGDKVSPLSDTTVLASGGAGVPLFRHIRYMMITTVPSLLITLIIFAVAGFVHPSSSALRTEEISEALVQNFNLSPWLLAVPVLTGVMIARRLPPFITLFLATALAVLFAFIFQSDILARINPDSFKAALQSVYGSTTIDTGNSMLTNLVATRGMGGMLSTIWLIMCALCFGGCMAAGGMVKGITRLFTHMIHGRASTVASTVASGIMLNIAIADQYLCILLTENMFKDIYDYRGLERRLLSRTTEDSVTVTSVLVPWNTCGMTQSTVLGVATLTYLPFCFFNLISPLMSILVGLIGYKIKER